MDTKQLKEYVSNEFDKKGGVIEELCRYIEIPNQSPVFDEEVLTNGYQDQAVKQFVDWVTAQNVPGLKVKVACEGKRTPVILVEIAGDKKSQETILMYGHLDKQPPMTSAWREGLGPRKPVIQDGKLYGRGGADDGYAIFTAVTAVKALKEQKISHARVVVLIEACEESGSLDLSFYMEFLKNDIGIPSLVICLDSGCGNYDQLWLTTSLRGLVTGTLRVTVLTHAIHSGSASGMVPSSFRIMRELLDRIEDSKTGQILLDEAYCKIPDEHIVYANEVAATLGDTVVQNFKFVQGARPMGETLSENILNRTWRPTISYTGMDGMPSIANAASVILAETVMNLSIRVPPLLDGTPLLEAIKRETERDPPYGAEVEFKITKNGRGWAAPPLAPWLEQSLLRASVGFYGDGKATRCWGEGGSIPFMNMLGERFPGTQFVIVGVLGPQSNAHGPNEFMHIEMTKNLTCCMAKVIADHFTATLSTNRQRTD